MTIKRMVLVILFAALTVSSVASAQSVEERRAELKQRFASRYPELNKIKNQGKVGETFDGFVEAIDRALVNADEQQLVKAENDDRKKLYQLIADEVIPAERNVPWSIVAQRNARRNFEKASPNDYLKVREGYWIQKKQEPLYERVTRLKRDGKIGETSKGYLEPVKPEYASDAEVKQVVAEENHNRQSLYERIAMARQKTTADAVAQEFAKNILENVQPGQFYKPASGQWVKKPEAKS